MTRELFNKVLSDTVQIITKDFRLDRAIVALSYGGESLLHPLFKEFAEAFSATGILRTQIVTNGILLDTPEKRQVIIDNFREIAVSIHNVPELSDVLQNVKAFKEQLCKGALRYFRTNIVEEEFRTRYGLMKVVHEIEAMDVEVKLISALTEEISRYVNDVAIRPEMCFVPYWYMGILWNGDVVPCCHVLSSGSWTLGNTRDRSLTEVFEDEPYRKLRMGDYAGTPCERCTIRA